MVEISQVPPSLTEWVDYGKEQHFLNLSEVISNTDTMQKESHIQPNVCKERWKERRVKVWVPIKLVLYTFSIKEIGVSARGDVQGIAALLTRMSILPYMLITTSTAALTLSSTVTSSAKISTCGCPLNDFMVSSDRDVATTLNPALQNSFASAAPIPPSEQPVMSTTSSRLPLADPPPFGPPPILTLCLTLVYTQKLCTNLQHNPKPP